MFRLCSDFCDFSKRSSICLNIERKQYQKENFMVGSGTLNRYMPMRDQTEYTATHWIPAVPSISQLVMAVTGKKWQSHMLMNLETVQNHQLHRMTLWAASVHSISHQVQQLANSAGTASLIIVHSEKVASAMGS